MCRGEVPGEEGLGRRSTEEERRCLARGEACEGAGVATFESLSWRGRDDYSKPLCPTLRPSWFDQSGPPYHHVGGSPYLSGLYSTPSREKREC